MANNERLTKRVKKIEEWIAENEGGPTLNNMNWLLETLRNASNQVDHQGRQMNMLRELQQEFLQTNELLDSWNEFIKEKDDAVQEQQTEEVSVQEEAESSEETIDEEKE
jgi:phosphoglycerate-specific signal transduction histidine kinase